MRSVYLVLAVLGFVVPYSQFLPWVMQHGLDVKLLFGELFATRIGAFFGLDVIIAAVVLIRFIRREGTTLQMRHLWLPIAATCLIGVSCGLPLFLYQRELRRPAAE